MSSSLLHAVEVLTTVFTHHIRVRLRGRLSGRLSLGIRVLEARQLVSPPAVVPMEHPSAEHTVPAPHFEMDGVEVRCENALSVWTVEDLAAHWAPHALVVN